MFFSSLDPGGRCCFLFFSSTNTHRFPVILLSFRVNLFPHAPLPALFLREKLTTTPAFSRTVELRRGRDTYLPFRVLEPFAAQGHVRPEVSRCCVVVSAWCSTAFAAGSSDKRTVSCERQSAAEPAPLEPLCPDVLARFRLQMSRR